MRICYFRCLLVALFCIAAMACHHAPKHTAVRTEAHDRLDESQERMGEEEEYDGPGLAMAQDFEKTKDPVIGEVPRELLWPAIEYTDQLKQDLRAEAPIYAKTALNGWVERGPNSDATGATNGNLRPGGGVAAGRIRAVLVDAADATGNTVFVGSVGGGLWKTTSITSAPAGWTLVNDKLSNLAITSICQDPSSTATIYFSTGEANYNSDAIQGDGIFKSTDGGATWSQLSSTTSANSGGAFNFCSKIICDASGNVYVGTRGGLRRSTDGGATWTTITPSGINAVISDIQISSTGRMHVTSGIHPTVTTAYYRFTDNPSTATSSTGWSSATTSFPTSSICHVVLACQGSTLIALPASTTAANVSAIYSSTDGGANWAALTNTPSFTSGQGWYCLAAAINPANSAHFMVGSLDVYKTTNSGGSAWTQASAWVGSSGNYIHADQHQIVWYTASSQSRVIVVSDGGIFLSTNGGTTFSDRNTGLRIKQFFSCALNPTASSDYLLGGAQDNGSHSFSVAGLGTTSEVTAGDGAFVHIDQNQPLYQFTSYVYNNYYRSSNGGTTWASTLASNTGLFINPTDYDNSANIMYCSEATSGYRRWTDPQTGTTSDVVAVTALSSGSVYAVAVSPFTSNRIYLGTNTGRLVMVDNAHNVSTPAAGTLTASSLGTISSITFGGTEDTMMVTNSSYSGTQVWYSTNATSATPTFTAKDGNLPNIPVRWALMIPNTYGKRVMIATETGVWVTADITAASPTWVPDATFPNVRTDMLKYRSSDKVVAAATHGRGMWTATAANAAAIALPINNFVLKGSAGNTTTSLSWTFKTARESVSFDIERSDDGKSFSAIANQKGGAGKESYTYSEARSSGWNYYRIKSTDAYGLVQYSNTVSMAPAAASDIQLSNVYPNPAKDQFSLTVSTPKGESFRMALYAVTGQKVAAMSQQLGAGSQMVSLPVAGIAPGNYLLTATVGQQRYSYVVIKQ